MKRINENYYELDFQLVCYKYFYQDIHSSQMILQEFPHEKDECYLAHCYPYTYSNLKDDIDELELKCANLRILQRDILCETRAGNTCFFITITDFSNY
jgi:hypothetical protein